MARVSLDLPETFCFSTDISVRITDLNYGNHLGHDVLLSLIHEARVRFFISKGFYEIDIERRNLVISDAVIIYLAEVLYGDLLEFHVTAGEPNRYGCDIFYKLVRKADSKLIAKAKTGIVFIDPETKKAAELPGSFKSAFLSD